MEPQQKTLMKKNKNKNRDAQKKRTSRKAVESVLRPEGSLWWERFVVFTMVFAAVLGISTQPGPPGIPVLKVKNSHPPRHARCTQARKTTHGLDRQHQVVPSTVQPKFINYLRCVPIMVQPSAALPQVLNRI